MIVPADSPPDAVAAERFAALAHPARLSILRWLARNGMCRCKDVVSAMPLAQSTVSQHLKVLVDAGLVVAEHRRPGSFYRLDREALSELARSTGFFVQACCAGETDGGPCGKEAAPDAQDRSR